MEIVKTFYLCALQGNTNLLKDLQKYHSIDVDISDKDGTTPLILASANNQLEVVMELLKMGADPNKVRKSGTGPLFFACQAGYVKVAELLINFGAKVNKLNRRDRGTPLLVAAQNGHTGVVDLLLNRGGDVNQQLKDGATAIFLAAQGGHTHTLEVLIKHGANVNLAKNDLTSPLYIASQMGHSRVVKKLLESGAEVDAAREDGSTSLFKASQKGHRLVIEALLKKGASTGLLGNGETALHMAALFGRTRISHLLLVNGADPLLKNKDGLTSHDLAIEAQYNDLVTVLESFEDRNSSYSSNCSCAGCTSKTVCLINCNSAGSRVVSGNEKNRANHQRQRQPHEPFTAPSSFADNYYLLTTTDNRQHQNHHQHHHQKHRQLSANNQAVRHSNLDDGSSQYSDSTTSTSNSTDQTTGTINIIPHFSAPTPLVHNIPYNKLYPGFMPPSNEAELISAIESMAKPSIVQKDNLKPDANQLTVQSNKDSSDSELVKQKNDINQLTKMQSVEELPINLEKLLATRHSNPEIREIEILRQIFGCCTLANDSSSTSVSSQEEKKVINGMTASGNCNNADTKCSEEHVSSVNNTNLVALHKNISKTDTEINKSVSKEVAVKVELNSKIDKNKSVDICNNKLPSHSALQLDNLIYSNSKPVYLKTCASPHHRGSVEMPSSSTLRYHHHYHHLHYHHQQRKDEQQHQPLQSQQQQQLQQKSTYVPPFNPPPPLPIPPHFSNALNHHSNSLFSSVELDKLPLDHLPIVVGKRKMSQPNLKTLNYDK